MKKLVTSLLLVGASLGAAAQCNISYTYTTSGNTITLAPSVTTSGIAYNIWNSAGSNEGTQIAYVYDSIQYTYSTSGIYEVCVTMYDSNWSCADTFCDSIQVGNGLGPTLSLSGADDTCANCSGAAWVTATGVGPFTYLWSNGGTTQTITGLCGGSYQVTVTDANSNSTSASLFIISYNWVTATVSTNDLAYDCGDTITLSATTNATNVSYSWSTGGTASTTSVMGAGSYTVTVSTAAGCQASADIYISWGGAILESEVSPAMNSGDAMVWIIQENNGFLTAIDSMLVDSGGLARYMACPGTYYIKAAATSQNASYSSVLPTYYDTTGLWSNATAIVAGSTGYYYAPFTLLSGTNSGGPGFIGGLISQGANRAEGDPVAGATVLVMNANGTVGGWDVTDANGEYAIDNLSLGTYKVYVDILNKTAYPSTVLLSSTSPEATENDFSVNQNDVRPGGSTGIDAVSEVQVSVFPNPASDMLTVQSELPMESIRVLSIDGRVMSDEKPMMTNYSIALSQWAAGEYLVETTTAAGAAHTVISVQH